VIRTLRSTVAPEAIAELVAGAYGVSADRCVLLRSLVNDVYRIDTADRSRVFKLYRAGHRTPDEVAWEVDLAAALDGVVAPGVRLIDGSSSGVVEAAEGPRPFSLWEWAPGAPPEPPFTGDLYRCFGAATAEFHAAGDRAGPPPRRFDVTGALGWPLDEVLNAVDAADRARFAEVAQAARVRLSDMDLDVGICHGDVSLDNVHLDGDRWTFYDLDRAGHGPRAADLAGVAATEHLDAFLDGYRSVRPFAARDLAAIPWLGVVDRIGNLHFHLVYKPKIRGTESMGEGWLQHNLEALRAQAAALLR
jgi:Ser/Thr protein kinase RdoA (MazF antagonist)